MVAGKHHERPCVSVVIPTYNRAHLVTESIDSVLAQDYPTFEVIVVDDGSTDDTAAVIGDRYGDRVRYIHQENAGPAAARNTGTQAAQGEYIAFLDDDDLWLPGKLGKQVAALESRPEYALAYTKCLFATPDGSRTERVAYDTDRGKTGDSFELVLRSVPILPSSVVMRDWTLHSVGQFYELLRAGEDTDMLLRLTMRYPVVYLDEPLVLMREHPGRGIALNHSSPARFKAGVIMWRRLLSILPSEREMFRSMIETNLVCSRLGVMHTAKQSTEAVALAEYLPHAIRGYEHLVDSYQFHYGLLGLAQKFETEGTCLGPDAIGSFASALAALGNEPGALRKGRLATFYCAAARWHWNRRRRAAALSWALRALRYSPVACLRHIIGPAVLRAFHHKPGVRRKSGLPHRAPVPKP